MLMKQKIMLLLWVMGFLLFPPWDGVGVKYPLGENSREVAVRLGDVDHMGAVTWEKAAGNDKGHKYLALPGSGTRRGGSLCK